MTAKCQPRRGPQARDLCSTLRNYGTSVTNRHGRGPVTSHNTARRRTEQQPSPSETYGQCSTKTRCGCRLKPQRTSRPIVAHATYGHALDERERVSSKGACDRRARTKSERRLHHASLFLKLRLVSARTKSERRLHHASLFLKLRLVLIEMLV